MTLEISRAHAQLLVALRRAPSSPRFVIIGAAALKHHVLLPRTTADVDLALVAEPEDIPALLEPLGWHADGRRAQRWRDREGHRVDVLPATDRIIQAGSLLLDGGSSLSVQGFDLALANTVLAHLPGEDEAVELASLGALVVLKMVAWMDRPYDRLRDLGDLARVLDHALDDTDERRWRPPLADLTFDEQSPFFVGREVATIAQQSHLTLVRTFLARLQNESPAWAATMAREGGLAGRDPESQMRLKLAAFERGINEPPPPK